MSSPSPRGEGLPGPGRLALAALLAAGLGLAAASPLADGLNRQGLDLLLPLRHWLAGPLHGPDRSAAVVIAIDEQTYRTPPFANTPKAAWTPQLGTVIQGVLAAEPKVIGLDVIFPTSLDRPGLLPGYDRPFLLALRQAADQGKMVLGQARLSAETIAPYPGQVLAAKGGGNVRTLNLKLDDDDVVRQYWKGFAAEGSGELVPSFGVELAARAGAALPPGDFLVNFNTGPGDVPVYSLADLHACALAGKGDFFQRHFAGKVVLLGEVLDLEDRVRTTKRLVQRLDGTGTEAGPERCALPVPPQRAEPLLARSTMAGVLVHAAAVNTLVLGQGLVPLSWPVAGLGMAVLLFAVSVGLLLLNPAAGGLLVLGLLGGSALAGAQALAAGTVLPLPGFALALAATYLLAAGFRVFVEGRERRRIKHAFRHYLSPALVDKLASDPGALKLGGERRWLSVMFSDIVGFTTVSESLREKPELLVELINRYLTLMSETVSRHGGYVDKFIGDAVMAVWGAPVDEGCPERRAVETALDCLAALDRFNTEVVVGQYGLPPLGTRFGIATGYAIAGNIGSASRLNYTVTGDMVNLAARLEGANKEYGSIIMVNETTAKALGDGFVLRRLDRLVVKGKTEPVLVHEVVGRLHELPAGRVAEVALFEAAMTLHDGRKFAEAAGAFAALSPHDPCAALYARRCVAYAEAPPPADWDGTFTMTTK